MLGTIARVAGAGIALGMLAIPAAKPVISFDDGASKASVREQVGSLTGPAEPEEEGVPVAPADLDAVISEERLAQVGGRMRYVRMPDGKVHVRIADMWRLGTSDVPARLIAVPAYGGSEAVEWEISPPRWQVVDDHDRPLVPIWRVVERPVEAYKRRTVLLTLVKRSQTDVLVGSCMAEMPGALQIPVARVSEPVDPTTIEREWMKAPAAPGVRLKLPWPRRVFDAWITVKAADGSSVWEGPVSRERMEYEQMLEGKAWAADPARAVIYFPKDMPEGELDISVRWLTEVP